MNKIILVTGGLGYIGAHVAKLLLEQNIEVIILDNIWHKRPNQIAGAKQIIGDVGDSSLLDHLFKQYHINAVIHLAGYIQVAESVKEPEKYLHNNVTNTQILLDAMVKHQCQVFVFSSSAAIFGEPIYVPINEEHPKEPLNPYGQSKLAVEQLLANHYANQQIKFAALRYFNAAGCNVHCHIGELHEPETHLIPLVLQVANGRRDFVTVYGDDYPTIDGTCLRDYIHVNDLSQAHLLAVEYLWRGGENLLLNLGTGTGYSVRQVIEVAEKITGKSIATKIYPRRAGDSPILVANGEKAKQILGWQPKFSALETIIADAWYWEKQLSVTAFI